MSNRRRRSRGFSLIELLIVIAIILIIITIAVPKYNRTQMYMRETAAVAAILATVVLGLAGTFTVLGQKPAPVLRAL